MENGIIHGIGSLLRPIFITIKNAPNESVMFKIKVSLYMIKNAMFIVMANFEQSV